MSRFYPHFEIHGRFRTIRPDSLRRNHGREEPETSRALPKDLVDEMVRRQRTRIEAEMAKKVTALERTLGRTLTRNEKSYHGLEMGDALRVCSGCGVETCREVGYLRKQGWVEGGGVWCCPECSPEVGEVQAC